MSSEERALVAVVGQPLRIPLGPGAATGYDWQLEPGAPVELLDADTSPGGAAPGDAVEQELVVVPAVAGEVLLVLRLVRPWEPDQPLRTRTVRLQVRDPEG